MSKFQVGLSGDFRRSDNQLEFADMELAALDDPNIEWRFVGELGAGTMAPEDVEDLDALILLGRRMAPESFHPNGRLALVARWGVGYDTVDVPACGKNNVALTIAPDGVRRPVAVAALALILACTGKLLIKDRLTRETRWVEKTDYNGTGLVGRTLGSIGIGNIGTEMFRLAVPFGMRFIACDPYVSEAHAMSVGVTLVDLETLFRESDVLCVHCPLNEETRHIVNAERLALMKRSAYLINTARGSMVDQAALVAALADGRIAGAGLDVLEQEPPDPDDPILKLDNVILNPHALCWTDQLVSGITGADITAVKAVMRGEVPKTIVNEEIVGDPTWRAKLAGFKERFSR